MPDYWVHIQSLYGPAAEGNWHTLLYKEKEQATPFANLTPELQEAPNLIQLSGPPHALTAHFYQRGQPVLRCGSANIAIAEAARQMFAIPEQGGWPLRTRAGPVWLGYDDRGPCYQENPQRQQPVAEAHLWRQVLAGDYHCGSYAGSDTDYCLLLLPTPIRQVQPSLQRLCHSSRRALILLYYQSPGVAQLRYFAPQYGTPEDAATGSACVQAAHFFWHRYGEERMTFVQQSGPGGYIQTETRGDQVRVRGQARLSSRSSRSSRSAAFRFRAPQNAKDR